MYLTAMMTCSPVYALDFNLNYNYSNPPIETFGKATSIEPVEVIDIGETKNINRSKDSAFAPPSFGTSSADTKGTGELLTPNISGVSPMAIGTGSNAGTGLYPSSEISTAQVSNINLIQTNKNNSLDFPPSSSMTAIDYSENKFTLPDGLYYSDNSIGRLEIPEINLSVKVYETESLESLAKGAGHFKSTSCWEGNVGICGHNRGVTNHFGKIHTLDAGDRIEYTTQLGTRVYNVVSVNKVDETDFSLLQRTSDNRITLVTCVNDQPSKRWCVQAVETH